MWIFDFIFGHWKHNGASINIVEGKYFDEGKEKLIEGEDEGFEEDDDLIWDNDRAQDSGNSLGEGIEPIEDSI